MNNITKSNEDYLETILILEENNIPIKSVEVAHNLKVTKAAVSIAMNDLIDKGLVNKESYGAIELTNSGREIATSIINKHKLIKALLVSIGVSELTAEIESCKIEHILSDETLLCLKKLRDKI